MILHQLTPAKIKSSAVCAMLTQFGTFGSICRRNGESTTFRSPSSSCSGSAEIEQIRFRPRTTAGTDMASVRDTFLAREAVTPT